jgi:hypothetical protein
MDRTRRAYLAAAAGVGLGTAAGCLGSGSGGAAGCTIEDEPTVSSLPAPTLGRSDAPVTVVAFEDFACPHCATYSLEVFPDIRPEYVETGVVRYQFRDFPVPVDERWSWQAASAARGVQDEMDDATFFEYAHALFENHGPGERRGRTGMCDPSRRRQRDVPPGDRGGPPAGYRPRGGGNARHLRRRAPRLPHLRRHRVGHRGRAVAFDARTTGHLTVGPEATDDE